MACALKENASSNHLAYPHIKQIYVHQQVERIIQEKYATIVIQEVTWTDDCQSEAITA